MMFDQTAKNAAARGRSVARASALVLTCLATNAAAQSTPALPSGNSPEFRRQMLGWQGDGAEVSGVVEIFRPAPRANLRISSPFGWRSDPIEGMRRRHAGVDLPAARGANVFATGAGIVTFAGWSGGYGNLVEVAHPGGLRTRYGHMSAIDVRTGDRVAQSQILGRVGSTGHSTGPHLHYEVRLAGAPVDPLRYMGQTAPSYEARWSPEKNITPRWVAWGEGGGELPRSTIR